MIIFQLLAFPSFAVFIFTLSNTKIDAWKDQILFFAKGMVLFIPVAILLLFLRGSFVTPFSPFRLYIFALLSEHLGHYIIVTGGFFLFWGPRRLERARFVDLVSFSTGYYGFLSLFLVLAAAGSYEIYHLFLLPVKRWGVILFSTFLLKGAVDNFGFARAAFIGAYTAVPLATASLSLLSRSNYHVLVFILVAVWLSAAFPVWLMGVFRWFTPQFKR
jgi:hypothetical protein